MKKYQQANAQLKMANNQRAVRCNFYIYCAAKKIKKML